MWKFYEKFASTTELHGFDLVLKYNKFWAAAWLCLTIAACGMCVNDVVNLVITYKSEPTIVNLALKPNLDLHLPNPTLCMEVLVDFTMTPAVFPPLRYAAQFMDRDVNYFLSATNNANNLSIADRDQLNLSRELRYFTYLMLSYIAEAELTYVGLNDSVLTSYVTSLATESVVDQFGELVNATIAHLYRRYLSENVSFANLKRLIGMDICRERTEFLVRLNDTHSETSRICTPLTITHLSFSMVCSKLFEDNSEDLTNYKTVTLSGSRVSGVIGSGANSNKIFEQKFSSTTVTFAWHLDFQGRPTLPAGSRQDVFTWNPYYVRAFDLTVATEYQFYSTKRDPCQTVEKQYDCIVNRRIKQMQIKCGCRPSSLLYGVTDMSLPTCSENPSKPVWILTNDDNGDPQYGNFTGICEAVVVSFTDNSCLRDCRLVNYQIEYSQPSKRLILGMATGDGLPSGILQFTVNMGKSRQLIEESPAKNFNTFICEFGGTIGAWLGASLLAFIHAAIHIVSACCDVGKHLRLITKK